MSHTTVTVELSERALGNGIEVSSREPSVTTAPTTADNDAPTATDATETAGAESSQVAEDETKYPTGTRFWLIMLSIGLNVTLGGMDVQIVSTAVPAITNSFHTVRDVGWYSSAYRLGMCSLQFTFGKLYKLFGLKQIFLPATLFCMLGSLLCATAPTSSALIAGRAVCGSAGAGLLAGTFAVLAETLPLRKRPLWLSIIIAIEGISYVSAPLIGGLILHRLSWRWCFWINLPLEGAAFVILLIALPNSKKSDETTWKQKLAALDPVGSFTLLASLTSLFLALEWAGSRYTWNSPIVLSLLVGSFILFLIFSYVQHRRQDAAILPPRILRNRTVIAGFIYNICCSSSIQVVEYYLPSYLQVVRNKTPLQSGVLMLPVILGAIFGSLVQGSGTTVVGYYVPFMLAGSIVMPIFAGLMTTITVKTALVKLGLFSGFLGFGSSIGYQAPQIAVQTVLPAQDVNIGLGIILFAGQFGPAVFLTAAQNIFSSRLVDNLQSLALNFTTASIDNMGLHGLKDSVPAGKLDLVLKGLDQSLSQTWYIAVALAALTLIGTLSMEWRHIRVKQS